MVVLVVDCNKILIVWPITHFFCEKAIVFENVFKKWLQKGKKKKKSKSICYINEFYVSNSKAKDSL